MIWKTLFPSTWDPTKLQWPIRDLNGLTDVWLHFTIAISAIALFWAAFRMVQSIWRSNRYLRSLRLFTSTEEFASKRDSWAKSSSLPLAKEFDELLVEVPRPLKPLEKDLKRCGSATEVFNTSSLAHGLIGNRFLLAMPAILTGLGVLGTFVGLQIGIGSLELDSSQIANLDKSIAPIIKGCSTAFATSVWGVVCSLIYTIADKFFEWAAVSRIRKLQNRLDNLVPRYTPEESMIELQRAAAQSESILKGLAIAIGDEMQKAMNRLGSSITDAVKDALGGQAQDLGKMSADLMSTALTDELGKLQQAVTGMADGFRQEFVGASQQLATTITGFDKLLTGVDETVKSSRAAMTQAVERLTAHEGVVKGLEEGAVRLKEAAVELTSMRETFTLSAQKNSDAAAAQAKAATVNESVANKLQTIGEKLPEIQESVSQGASVIASLGQPLLDLREILGRTPEIFGQQAEAQAVRDEKRSSLLLQQTEQLAATVSTAAEKFAQIDTLAQSLGISAVNLERAGSALGVLADGIEKASQQHLSAALASEKAANAGERTAERLQPIPESIAGLSSTLSDAGRKIREGADAAKDVYGQLLEHQKQWFRGIEVGLGAMRDRVQEILDQYGESVEGNTRNHMEQWTAAVNDSLSKFAVHVQTLEGAINDLTSEMNS
jgi:uncharacterized protein YgfB (UPF0149 family)